MQVDAAIHPTVSGKGLRGATRPDAVPAPQEGRPGEPAPRDPAPRRPAAPETPRPVTGLAESPEATRDVVLTREIEARGLDVSDGSPGSTADLNEALDRGGAMREQADPGQLIDTRA